MFPLELLEAGQREVGESAGVLAGLGRPLDDGGIDPPKWWLVHTKPRQEKKLAEHLCALGVPHFLPVTKCKTITRGRPRVTRAPLFPGYLFLKCNPQQRRCALETNRIVATHPISDEAKVVRQLWDLADMIEKGVPLRVEERLVSGQFVRVKSGLLKDKCGIVMKRAGKTRLFIFVNEFLSGVSLEIEQHMLEPYGAPCAIIVPSSASGRDQIMVR